MPIRLSGMTSGLDTDALVKELVSAYSLKKDKVYKAQVKHQWTTEAWKETNSKVYNFYTNSLSSMRYSSAYNLKKAVSSNSLVADVSASSGAVTGTQTLSVSSLAASGYLTGGKVQTEAGGKVTSSTKVSELGISASSIKVNDTRIDITEDTTVASLVSKLKSAGVGANFDDKNQRFFISATSSGADGDFTITAADSEGINSLKKLGLYATKDSEGNATKEMSAYTELADADASELIESRYAKAAYTESTYTKYITSLKDTATSGLKSVNKSLEKYTADDYKWEDDFKTEEEYNKKLDELNEQKTKYEADEAKYSALLESHDDLIAAMDAENQKIHDTIASQVNTEIETAKAIVGDSDLSSYQADDAVRITGKDAVIKLNGATFTSDSDSFSINGLNINVTGVTTDSDGKDTPITITTTTDTQGIYDKIKALISGYNEMIGYIDGLYNAESAAGYEPLTDEEKEALTESQIEEWEEKIKASLLRKNSTLGGISSALVTSIMGTSVTVNGQAYSLSSFGISSSGYFVSDKSDRNKLHIAGNPDDSTVSGNTDKLMAAINSDPEAVVEFFTKLSENMYDTLSKKMSSTSLSSAFTIYNDKEMSSQYSDYSKKLSDWEDKLKDIEEQYYKKFAAMEAAMSKMQSQMNYLSSMMGTSN